MHESLPNICKYSNMLKNFKFKIIINATKFKHHLLRDVIKNSYKCVDILRKLTELNFYFLKRCCVYNFMHVFLTANQFTYQMRLPGI